MIGGWKCTRQNKKPKADCEKIVKLTGLVRLIKGKQRDRILHHQK